MQSKRLKHDILVRVLSFQKKQQYLYLQNFYTNLPQNKIKLTLDENVYDKYTFKLH